MIIYLLSLYFGRQYDGANIPVDGRSNFSGWATQQKVSARIDGGDHVNTSVRPRNSRAGRKTAPLLFTQKCRKWIYFFLAQSNARSWVGRNVRGVRFECPRIDTPQSSKVLRFSFIWFKFITFLTNLIWLDTTVTVVWMNEFYNYLKNLDEFTDQIKKKQFCFIIHFICLLSRFTPFQVDISSKMWVTDWISILISFAFSLAPCVEHLIFFYWRHLWPIYVLYFNPAVVDVAVAGTRLTYPLIVAIFNLAITFFSPEKGEIERPASEPIASPAQVS